MQYFEGISLITFSKLKESNNLVQEKKRFEQQKMEELSPRASEHLHTPTSAPNFLQSKRAKLACV